MITNKELEAINLSATHRDFYQIWNELLDISKKLSERWDPTSTNESDPGIVLLKVLTAIADKLNYTIDKNTLEAFMPSAAQEESMRKLCEMMGYNIKYYQSATTDATITYVGEDSLENITYITIPKYTNLKNNDDDINYFTLNDICISDGVNKSQTVAVMEGEVITCADNTDNIVSITQLDDNFRYYLPESQIAENGIFITNISDLTEGDLWVKVENLNTQLVGTKCFKFGFDSLLKTPYIQFPDDIGNIIEDGLIIRYVRTNGVNGNISAKVLSKLEAPAAWSEITSDDEINTYLNIDNFTVTNTSSAINGKNKETIDDAYMAYKKTVGTFDTLVTCRDYMNKIYQLTKDDASLTPIVSNVIVSDIRDDINRAVTLCSFDEFGILYKDLSLKNLYTTIAGNPWDEAGISPTIGDIYYNKLAGVFYQYLGTSPISSINWRDITTTYKPDKISHFDLVIYPFTTVTGLNTELEYKNSFTYTTTTGAQAEINEQLNDIKTISHNFIYPDSTDLVCVKNYIKLKAKITTKTKVNAIEESSILSNIYSTIYTNFNSRKLDFGENIPFDSILTVIKESDTRIKNVALEEPTYITSFATADGNEYFSTDSQPTTWKKFYNKLARRNILAGRIPLFNYDKRFATGYTNSTYTGFNSIYAKDTTKYIGKLTSNFDIYSGTESVTLDENEVVQFRLPSFNTTKTFPAYVNYYLHLNDNQTGSAGVPATFQTLDEYLNTNDNWQTFVNNTTYIATMTQATISTQAQFNTAKATYGALFTFSNSIYTKVTSATYDSSATYYYFLITDTTYGILFQWIQNQVYKISSNSKLNGIYRSLGSDQSRTVGYLIDINKIKYAISYQYRSSSPSAYFIQVTHSNYTSSNYTEDGLGRNASYSGIAADADYKLKAGEYLCINYTPSTTADEAGSAEPINLIFTDICIRPNFNLIDSTNYRQTHSPSKTSGYDFTINAAANSAIATNGGLFTLGASEQIEIREQVIIDLDDTRVNIYWERNDDQTQTPDNNGYITFKFNEDPLNESGASETERFYQAYTLKSGEYFYYTDSSKLDLAYYGSGTVIRRAINTPILKKKKLSTSITGDIANNGLLAAIDWVSVNCGSVDKKITLQEYQYVTLTKGDVLNIIETSSSSTSGNTDKIDTNLTSNWQPITRARYTLYGSDTAEELPIINYTGLTWAARTILNFDVSAVKQQNLHTSNYSNSGVSIKTKDSVNIYFYDTTNNTEIIESGYPIILTPTDSSTPLSFLTNYSCQTSNGEIDTHIYSYNSNGEIDINLPINDFSVNVFKYNTIQIEEAENGNLTTLALNNYGNGDWTKISFNTFNTDSTHFTINTNIPSGEKGLIMFYYFDQNKQISNSAYIKAATDSINIFNAANYSSTLCNNGKWWSNGSESVESGSTNYHFRNGLNIVEVDSDCVSLEIYPDPIESESGSTKHLGILIFSNLNLCYTASINSEAPLTCTINPRICYNNISANSASEQLYLDISKEDLTCDFYYNAPIDNSTMIDLNTNITINDDSNVTEETLASPITWYDYNNINNKFVISEINVESMKQGIVLTNSSRK